MLLLTSVGALSAAVVLAFAIPRGRHKPVRRWAWVTALIILGVPAGFLLPASVAAMVAGQVWMTVGVVGLWIVIATAWLRPRWGAALALGTAVGMPLLAFAIDTVNSPQQLLPVTPWHVLAAYSGRSVIAGLALLVSMRPRRPDSAERDGGDDPGGRLLLESQGDRAGSAAAHQHG